MKRKDHFKGWLVAVSVTLSISYLVGLFVWVLAEATAATLLALGSVVLIVGAVVAVAYLLSRKYDPPMWLL